MNTYVSGVFIDLDRGQSRFGLYRFAVKVSFGVDV
jgi:hypothetical protein